MGSFTVGHKAKTLDQTILSLTECFSDCYSSVHSKCSIPKQNKINSSFFRHVAVAEVKASSKYGVCLKTGISYHFVNLG